MKEKRNARTVAKDGADSEIRFFLSFSERGEKGNFGSMEMGSEEKEALDADLLPGANGDTGAARELDKWREPKRIRERESFEAEEVKL